MGGREGSDEGGVEAAGGGSSEGEGWVGADCEGERSRRGLVGERGRGSGSGGSDAGGATDLGRESVGAAVDGGRGGKQGTNGGRDR